jgi:hypothetical protein
MSHGTLKPIETHYKGYRFRSRLEARWAVFFDALPLKWEFEKEGFELGNSLLYLPDFWLPEVKMWAEVKTDEFTAEELEKAETLAAESGYLVLALVGPPDLKSYWAIPSCDYVLSGRYLHENRFFATPGWDDDGMPEDEFQFWDDTVQAVHASRAARFEFGEEPSIAPKRRRRRTMGPPPVPAAFPREALPEKLQVKPVSRPRSPDCDEQGFNWRTGEQEA